MFRDRIKWYVANPDVFEKDIAIAIETVGPNHRFAQSAVIGSESYCIR
ncbi:hypothetical protein [Haloquadratum walsbyi]|nr:hypothetical protein [Haloquadratum walsbyi]